MKTEVIIKEEKKVEILVDKIEKLNSILLKNKFSKCTILTHKSLWKLYSKKFKDSSFNKNLILFPEGEKIKSFHYLKLLYKKFLEYKFDRNSVLIIFGGGVLGDLGTFAASTYMRGINVVQIPTTLLAMIDSSIGGKTAINLPEGKNLVGSFYQPKTILCDLEFIKTLPKDEIHNALGEILKYALLNKKIFSILNKDINKDLFYSPIKITPLLQELVLECIKTKLDIIRLDEKELLGLREKLNLGHTIAHGLETVMGFKTVSHGKSVILGLLAETYISNLTKMLPFTEFIKIESLIERYVKDINFNKRLKECPIDNIIECLKYDKKVRMEKIRFILPKKVGFVVSTNNVSKEIIKKSIEYIFNHKKLSWI